MPTNETVSTRVEIIPQTGRWAIVLALGLILTMLLFVITAPGASAQPPACQTTVDDGVTVFGSIQDAIDAAGPGDTIKLAGTCAGITTQAGTDQTGYIDKPLTLRGGYDGSDWSTANPASFPTTLDAQGAGRVLRIDGAAPVTVQDLTVTGGAISGLGACPDGCGGGIMATGSISLTNVIVLASSAERMGGGLAAMAAANIFGSRFEGNATTGGLGAGGGMRVFGPLLVEDSTFASNTSSHIGGGISAFDADAISVSGSTFDTNHAGTAGGGLQIEFSGVSSGPVSIDDNTFLGNTAGTNNGGGISAFQADMTIADSYFENNSCSDPGCDGGAVRLFSSFAQIDLELTDSEFVGNSAGRYGGAVHTNVPVTVLGGRFEENAVSGGTHAFSEGGGGLSGAGVQVDGTVFTGNSSGEDGGALLAQYHVDFPTTVVRNATFSGNDAGANGGAVALSAFQANPAPTIDTSEFTNNVAGQKGGGLWAAGGELVLAGGRFEGNQSDGPPNDGGLHQTDNGGGAVWAGGAVQATDVEFLDNSARTNGGALHARGDVTLSVGRFEGNQAQGDFSPFGYGGGALYTPGNVDLSGTEFISNRATYHGGALFLQGALTGQNALFQENSGWLGGGVYGFGGPAAFSGFRFLGNEAGAGGGLWTSYPISITHSLFQDNRATGANNSAGQGGGLVANTATLDPPGVHQLTGTQFIGNEAASSGGGANLTGRTVISATLFQENHSGGPGGGLSAFIAFPDILEVIATDFVGNVATGNGGGASSLGWAKINGGRIEGNESLTGSGGGLHTPGRLDLAAVELSGNTAALDGGGAFANSGGSTTGGSFQGNVAGGNGGGLSSPAGEVTSVDSLFAGNQAGLQGGGLFGDFRVTLTGGAFSGNLAGSDGGGLHAGNSLWLERASFVRNASGGSGGGVHFVNDRSGADAFWVRNSLFAANSASANGAGLYFAGQNDTLEIAHNTFAAPTRVGGQALYADNGTLEVINSIVANHQVGIAQAGDATVNENYTLFFDNGADTSGVVGGGAGSLGGDPAFVDPAGDDYHLTAASAALDRGTGTGVLADFEGDARPNGPGPDAGYDEFIYLATDAFVTGGGWFQSPTGAFKSDPPAAGKANYGFVAKFPPGGGAPTGNTEFHLKAGDLKFQATSYDWLVVAGAKAAFQGVGTIDGGGSYGFLMSLIDGSASKSDSHDTDMIRIKIWDLDDGDAVVYDNQVCGDSADNADPCTEAGGGNIAIHHGKE